MIGSGNYLMATAHVAHNCRVGNGVIMANGTMLGGHAVVEDRAILSGNSMVHQFVRIGTLSIMRGGSAASMDLPPYTVALGVNGLCGLNTVGLRRAGMTPAERLELKRLYHLLFRSGQRLRTSLAQAREIFSSAPARVMMDFVAGAKRGVIPDRARRSRTEETAVEE